jgi:hypothetical protein
MPFTHLQRLGKSLAKLRNMIGACRRVCCFSFRRKKAARSSQRRAVTNRGAFGSCSRANGGHGLVALEAA